MKTYTQQIIKKPTQIFEQGRIGDDAYECPLQLQAYEGAITIQQESREVVLHPDAVEDFIKVLRNFKKSNY